MVDDSDTTNDGTRSRSIVGKQERTSDHNNNWDDEGFTPVRKRQDRRQRRSQTPDTPTPDRKLPATQNREKRSFVVPPVPATSPPDEIRLTDRHDPCSNLDEDAMHLPVQMDTITEILQERLLEMTATIDRREQNLIDKIQTTEDRLHKSERKTSVERQHHRQYTEKTIKRLEDWEETLLQRE